MNTKHKYIIIRFFVLFVPYALGFILLMRFTQESLFPLIWAVLYPIVLIPPLSKRLKQAKEKEAATTATKNYL